jgi:signal transduction histidine kinase
MKLRTKTIITVFIVSLLMFGALQLVTFFVIQPSFTNLEKHESEKSVNQALNAISYRLSNLKGEVKDYSSWDDTYNFVKDGNQDFVANNFVDATFENLNLDLVAIVDINRSLVYCQSFDLDNSSKVQTSMETRNLIASDSGIWEFPSSGNSSLGIMLVDNQLMLMGTGPILTSWDQGPRMGGILFGRYIDDQEVSQLDEITNLNFSFYTVSDFRAKIAGSQIVDSLLSNEQTIVVKESGPDAVSGYALIRDVHSNPIFVLQISQDRAASQQGAWVRDIFLWASIVISFCFGGGFLIFLEREIVKPMTKLAGYVEDLPLNPNISEPKALARSAEEIVVLTNAIRDSMKKKLEGMNEVSRMVAHDLRNPLTGIRGASYVLKKTYGARIDEKGNEMLKTIDNCVEYSEKIVADLLDYSREIKLDKIKSNPRKLVTDSLSTLAIQSNIQVINEATDEFSVLVDNGKIQRVFGNLIKNAFDAMPEGGQLKITSRKVDRQVEIAFYDSGLGMSKDVLEKLWTPFFTTKSKGMGIGLAICKRIIDAHGGRIDVKSTLGKGTIFTVILPRTD